MERPVALITGVDSSIGRAAALLLAENAYRIALVGRTRQPITGTARASGQRLQSHTSGEVIHLHKPPA
ncbi:MAG TPA: hypothetical protein VHY37_11615 [Tepidisphaeraceae bacterium]|jgi:NAD(P)-dependent dehydrogenase (short-subunit alcohol dehydrogenase family)|nr:hypothetical protein [Tepidisphaeraceae bacterium]